MKQEKTKDKDTLHKTFGYVNDEGMAKIFRVNQGQGQKSDQLET